VHILGGRGLLLTIGGEEFPYTDARPAGKQRKIGEFFMSITMNLSETAIKMEQWPM